jgi:hypothetical protein
MGQVPFPPDSVYAEMLGPDSAMYVSWQEPDSGGLVVEAYNIIRLSDFDPEGDPETGAQTWFLSHNWPACDDPQWPDLEYGWYAYGVTASYTNGMISEMAVSNIVGHDMYCNLSVTVSLNNGEPAANAHVAAYGSDYTYQQYFGKDSVTVTIDSVMRGHYTIAAYHTGFDTGYLENVLISQDALAEITLGQRKRPVYVLYVDSVSLMTTWGKPALVSIYEDFEGEQFPPPGWQVLTPDDYIGWFRSLNGSTGEFTIPPHDGYYAVCTGMYGTGPHNACCDYLVTPSLDLAESEDYYLEFDSFYDGSYGHLAFVEYSYDRGETWEVMWQLNPGNKWYTLSISLSGFCGPEHEYPLWIAFHGDDAGEWGSGWAVDNVKIYVPGSQVEYTDFNLFLDDSLVTNTTNTSWSFAPLNYGQHYTASVSVNYPYGTSKRDYFSFTSRYLPPPLNFTAQDYIEDVVLQWYPPDDGLIRSINENKAIPENLLGYNLYENDVFLEYVTHSSANEVQLYIDINNYPGFYQYEVSGIYDLEPYGFPGDTGESMRIGTEMVSVDYCSELDFHEDWGWGNFLVYQWQTNTDEWRINAETGNPAPCAEFLPDTILSNYSSPLMSYPLCGHLISEGMIWLDFDLSLISNNNTGNEKLKVEIWNRVLNNWKTIRVYSNLNGNISWGREHCFINAYAKNDIFRVRFVAEGVNSADIGYWRLDNIDIRRDCPGPDSLWLEEIPESSSIALHWSWPEPYLIDTMIFWGDGESSGNSTGTGQAAEFDVAQRWEPGQLLEYDGTSITEIAFFPKELSCAYQVRIWTGPNAENLVISQPYDPVIGQWNMVTLDQPILIDAGQELWIGYHVNTLTGYPVGLDHGPAINGYGNMINFGGWQTLLDINPGLNYNWCIKAHIKSIDNKKITLSTNMNGNVKAGKTRDLIGYNIYRKIGVTGGYGLFDFITEGPCIYTVMMDEWYCYRVSAVWSGEYDHCESEWTNEACAMISVGINDPCAGNPEISLFPNPTKDFVMISSSENIKRITIYEISGKIITDNFPDDNNYCLQTTGIPGGLTVVKIETGSTISFHKLVINH